MIEFTVYVKYSEYRCSRVVGSARTAEGVLEWLNDTASLKKCLEAVDTGKKKSKTKYPLIKLSIMRKMKFLLIATISLLFLSGCGMTSNMASNIYESQTSVVLSQANFHVVKTVSAEVSSTYFLGLGGINRKSLRNNAVAELTKKANLTGSQALVNITVKSAVKTIFILNEVTFYAEATVIEFDE